MAAMAQPKVEEVYAYIVNGSADAMDVVYQVCPTEQPYTHPICKQHPVSIKLDGKNGNNSATVPIKYNPMTQLPRLYVLSAQTKKGQKAFGTTHCLLSNANYLNTIKLSDEDRKGSISCFKGESR